MDVFQCPCCELRFRTGNELLQHVSSDHPRMSLGSTVVEDALAQGHRHRHATHYEAGPDRNSQ